MAVRLKSGEVTVTVNVVLLVMRPVVSVPVIVAVVFALVGPEVDVSVRVDVAEVFPEAIVTGLKAAVTP